MTQLVLCCVVVCAMTVSFLGILKFVQNLFQSLERANQEQRQTIESLTKLAASKDIAAFHSLEAASGQMPNVKMPYTPMDDESVARTLMERYAEQGIDPNFALAPDSDPLEDFGGKSALY